jgi:hypothetical protein
MATADRWTVLVGGQSRYYSSAATAALFYQAETLTPPLDPATLRFIEPWITPVTRPTL